MALCREGALARTGQARGIRGFNVRIGEVGANSAKGEAANFDAVNVQVGWDVFPESSMKQQCPTPADAE